MARAFVVRLCATSPPTGRGQAGDFPGDLGGDPVSLTGKQLRYRPLFTLRFMQLPVITFRVLCRVGGREEVGHFEADASQGSYLHHLAPVRDLHPAVAVWGGDVHDDHLIVGQIDYPALRDA